MIENERKIKCHNRTVHGYHHYYSLNDSRDNRIQCKHTIFLSVQSKKRKVLRHIDKLP